MKRITVFVMLSFVWTAAFPQKKAAVNETGVRNAMKRATEFMYGKVGNNGGFLWSYEKDMSRMWGELEAYPSMVWVENSTPDVGHIMLDAYHATGDEYYYGMAVRTANILIYGQLPCGGWNYKFDLAGAGSEKRWYETIGKNAWGAGEHGFYYGNATFDDNVTFGAATFLLRIYLEKYDPAFKPALDKAVDMVIDSQYPVGGWPQRWPLMNNHPDPDGTPDYSGCITLNDDVADNNIKFLTDVYFLLGEERVLEPLLRAMNCIRVLQQGYPSAGWADQYYLDLTPAKARDFEPAAVSSRRTQSCIMSLMNYYRLTGDGKFMLGIPEAIEFLESVALDGRTAEAAGRKAGGNTIICPRFIAPGTATPLYLHRRGSHVSNGEYYTNQNPENTIGHYASIVAISILHLREKYDSLMALPQSEVTKGSPFFDPSLYSMPRYFITQPKGGDIGGIISSLDEEGRWLVPLTRRTPPYTGRGNPNDPVPENYSDTESHPKNTAALLPDHSPGISTHAFISNMAALLSYFAQ